MQEKTNAMLLVVVLALGVATAVPPEHVPPDGSVSRVEVGVPLLETDYVRPVAETDVTYVDIIVGTSGNYWPWATSGSSIRFQMLYLASEITRGGQIIEWGYRNYWARQRWFNNVTIKMCHTSISSLTSSFNGNYGGNTPDTVFFSSSHNYGTAGQNNWELFTLDDAFAYNGTSNLLIEIVWNGYGAGSDCPSYRGSRSSSRRAYAWNWQAATATSVDTYLYNARFGFEDATHDVGATYILVPPAIVDSGTTVTPACSVYNYGNQTESYAVRMEIGAGYDTTVSVSSHTAGTARYVTFPDWTADELGTFALVCSTELTGDADSSNDAQTGSVFVRLADVGAVSITVPSGSYLPGDIVVPAATWHNHGNMGADFEAWMVLFDPTDAQVYTEKIDVVGLAAGADTVLVGFPPCTLNTSGAWTVRCSTYLAGDLNSTNDVITGPFVVGNPDMNVVNILAPGSTLDTNEAVVPSVRIRSQGDVSVPFVAWFMIEDPTAAEVYREDVLVDWLIPATDTVMDFPEWPGSATIGPWRGRCSLAIADDDPSNDTLSRGFHVNLTIVWPPGWIEVEPMPLTSSGKPAKRGGWLALHGDGMIYAAKGYKTSDFYSYDPVADTWVELADIRPGAEGKMPDKGCKGISDGDNLIYMTKGKNTFGYWQYKIDADSWTPLPDVPEGHTGKKVKGGTDLVYVDLKDTGFVYMLKGYKTEFWRYNTVSGLWQARADAPTGIKYKWDKGSWIAADVPRGHGRGGGMIYAHKAKYYDRVNYTHEFWKYDIDADTWYTTQLAGMPLYGLHSGRIKKKKAKDGGAGAVFDDCIYAIKGGNTQQFWMYDILGDTWTEQDTVPTNGSTNKKKRVKYGADLVSWGGGAFFALKGNKTLEMWRYALPVPPAMSRPERSGVMGGVVKAGRLGVTLAPNPLTGGFATLRYSLPMAGPATINVFDVTGRSVMKRSVPATRTGAVSLDVRSLSAGIYLVRFDTDGYTATQKLVVQK